MMISNDETTVARIASERGKYNLFSIKLTNGNNRMDKRIENKKGTIIFCPQVSNTPSNRIINNLNVKLM